MPTDTETERASITAGSYRSVDSKQTTVLTYELISAGNKTFPRLLFSQKDFFLSKNEMYFCYCTYGAMKRVMPLLWSLEMVEKV